MDKSGADYNKMFNKSGSTRFGHGNLSLINFITVARIGHAEVHPEASRHHCYRRDKLLVHHQFLSFDHIGVDQNQIDSLHQSPHLSVISEWEGEGEGEIPIS